MQCLKTVKYNLMVHVKYCLFFIFRRLVMENSYAPDSYIDSVSNRYFFLLNFMYIYVCNLCLHVFTIR